MQLACCTESAALNEPDPEAATAAAADAVRHVESMMASTPGVADLDPEHAARLHEKLGSTKGVLAMKTQDKSLAIAAIEHDRAALRHYDTAGNALSAACVCCDAARRR